jgi:hypothetical protein
MSLKAQRSMAGGVLAPALFARVDTVKYQTGLRTCRNWMVLKEGGVSNKPGTEFICEVKYPTKTTILIPFIFNDDQTYQLEFGDRYMRVIHNGIQLTVSGVVAWNGATAYVVGNLVSRAGIYYYCILAHTNHQPPNATYWYALTGTIYEIPTPYLEADLETLEAKESADVVTITHKNYPPSELSRTGHTTWILAAITFTPGIAAPTGVSASGGAGTVAEYVVTAVAQDTFEESLASSVAGSAATPSSGSPVTVSWTAVSGAQEYNVYKNLNGIYGFIGVAGSVTFDDIGIDADTTDTPPSNRNLYPSTGNYPATSSYIQQRRAFADTTNKPETIDLSKTGNFKNFSFSSPLQDDDSLSFRLAGTEVNEVRHMIDLERLIVFTSGGVWSVEGDSAGIITPGQVNPKQRSYRGASIATPVIVGDTIIYVQARGSVVRDFANDAINGTKDSDKTIFAAHLFKGYTIICMDYQENPNSIIWVVRKKKSTGVRDLIGLTYVKEHEIWGWHAHDTDGNAQWVSVTPEGDEDFVYYVVKRTINGVVKRYIERQFSRQIEDVIDSVFLDCSLSYDGRNTGATTMTLSGSGWTHNDTLTLTASAGFFVVGDVGNEIHMTGADGTVIRFEITGYTDDQNVLGTPNKDVPVSMQAVDITDWSKAIKALTGLGHLEAKDVGVFADRFVVASPYNKSYTVKTVTSGAITLDIAHVVIHVGLPIIADIETLDIDTVNGETLIDKKKIVAKVVLLVEKTRGLFAGGKSPNASNADDPYLNGLDEFKLRNLEGYDEAVDLITGTIEVKFDATWNNNGRVFIRQVDPVPATILSITPVGMMVPRG